MEHYIQRAGGPLPALLQVIETDVGKSLFCGVPPLDTAGYTSLLDTVTNGLNDFFDHLFSALHRAYREQRDAHAQGCYLAECQRTLLRLAGHLLQYTQPVHLYASLSQRSFRDACCYHIYQALDRLLDYTVELGDGRIDPTLPLPGAARTALQGHLAGDLAGLRQRLGQRLVTPSLIDIVLAPFEALPRQHFVTFYTLYYLRTVKQALLDDALPGHDATGDERVLAVLAAHNFNAPEFIAYCRNVAEGQLKTCPSREARRELLHRYQVDLAMLPCLTPLALLRRQPSVHEQLSTLLTLLLHAPVPARPATDDGTLPELADDETDDEAIPDRISTDDLTFLQPPAVIAAIGDAAHQTGGVRLGINKKHRAALLARIPSVHGQLHAASIRRAFNDPEAQRKALLYLKKLCQYLSDAISRREKSLR